MDIREIFLGKSKKLLWERLNPSHVVDGVTGQGFEKDEAYFVLRMKEMHLATTRKLWRRFYPMLHSFLEYNNTNTHAVAGPGQLKELGEANLDRVINLNYRLAGPTAYMGGDVSILVGLYSVPGEDAARALVDTVGVIANLSGLALGQAINIANAVKTGVENIVGLDEARLELGIRDSFFQNNPLQSGYYVGINAPRSEVDFDQLWLDKGRLIKGSDPVVGVPYKEYDYMVLEIERRTSRDDWPGLPGIAEFQQKFSAIMRDSLLSVQEKRERLKSIWTQFTQVLAESPHLIRPDREQIAESVSSDLKARLRAMESGNPFETRGWADGNVTAKLPTEFDFLDVPDYVDHSDATSVRSAKASLMGNPFAV